MTPPTPTPKRVAAQIGTIRSFPTGAGRGSFAVSRRRDELRRSHLGPGVFTDPGELVPVEAAVEPHAEPPAVADVRRDEEPLRVGLDEHALHPVGSGAPDREAPVAVVVREH